MIGNYNDQYPCPPSPEHNEGYCFNPQPPCPPVHSPRPPAPCPPPPEFPGMCPPPLPPHPPLMPPAPSVVEGSSLYQAFNCLNDRVNICINTYNQVMQNGYKVLRDMQRAAEVNGAYYTKGEVWTEEGYSAEESAVYTIIHKANIDKKGNPIRVELHLGYGNTTNSKVPQNIFSASQITFADKIVVAQPMGPDGWYGNVIYRGTPLPHADQPTLYTMGWTRSGVMKVYNNSVNPDQMLCDTIENAMGVAGVLIQNGQILESTWYNQIPNYDKQVSRICIGQNMQTREVIILCCGASNDINRKGMTSITCANILRQYGCDIAVEVMEGANTGAADKGRLLFDPPGDDVPEAYAYWYITRKCHYHNDFQNEIGKLTQIYGEQLWRTHLAENKVNGFDDRLKDEIAAREQGDQELDTKIEAETARATAAEKNLQDQIDGIDIDAVESGLQAEIDRAKAAEAALDAKIDTTKTELDTKIDETKNELTQDISDAVKVEKDRAEAAEALIQQKITAEENRAETAEQTLQQNITAEQQRAQQAESDLSNKITLETERATQAESTLDTKFTGEISRIDALYQTLTNQVTTMDTAVTEMQKTINEIEITLNNMKQLISEAQTLVREVKNLLDAIEAGTADIPYVKIIGDTMTGNLHMGAGSSGNSNMILLQTSSDEVGIRGLAPTNTRNQTVIGLYDTTHTGHRVPLTNVGRPLLPSDAVPLDHLEEQLAGLKDGSEPLPVYVKKAGDTMTGPLNLAGNATANLQAVPKQQLDSSVKAAQDASKEYTDTAIDGVDAMLDSYYPKTGGLLSGNLEFNPQATNSANSRLIEFKLGSGLTTDSAKISSHAGAGNVPYLYIGRGSVNTSTGAGQHPVELRGVDNPKTDNSAANKKYADGKVAKTGGAMTGDLHISRTNTGSGDSPRLVFDAEPNGYASIRSHSTANSTYLYLESGYGGNNNQPVRLTHIAPATQPTDALNLEGANSRYLKQTGGDLTGPLAIAKNSTEHHRSYDFTLYADKQDGTAQGSVKTRSIWETTDNNPRLHFFSYGKNGVQRTEITGVATPTRPTSVVPLDYLQSYVDEHAGNVDLVKNIIIVSDYGFKDNPRPGSFYIANMGFNLPTGTTVDDWNTVYYFAYTSAVLNSINCLSELWGPGSMEGVLNPTIPSSYVSLSVVPAYPLKNPRFEYAVVGNAFNSAQITCGCWLLLTKKGNLL